MAFRKYKSFSFWWSQFSYVSPLVVDALGIISKKPLPNPTSQNFMYFPLRFIIPVLTLRSLIHLDLIFYTMWGRGLTSFSRMWISCYPSTISCKDYPFPIELYLCPCQRSWTVSVRVYFWIWSHPIDLYVYPVAGTTQPWLLRRVSLEIKKCESTISVLFQDFGGTLLGLLNKKIINWITLLLKDLL